MVKCSKIIKMQRDIHTTVLSSLEGIAEQVCVIFLTNKKQILIRCD